MRTRPKRLPVLLSVLAGAAVLSSAVALRAETPAPSAETLQSFAHFVAERMAYDRIPGLSIGFIKGDFTWVRGFGWADLENQSPAKPESSYRLASITKTITAVAVLELMEEGKIRLDAEVQTYVPSFPRKKWPVTVGELLGHVGGISHYKDEAVEGHIKEPKNTRQALAIFQDFDLVAEPGTKYNYSSYGYNLLGAVIEGASGLPYGEFIQSRIFEPLGMTDSRLDDPLAIIPNRVRGYQIVKGELKNSEYVDISSRFAAGGTRSTVPDLLKYARGIQGRKLLKEVTWREMFSPQVLRNGTLTGYGLGWGVEPWNGHFAVEHGGAQPETRTQILVFPAEDFAAAVACNLEGANLMPYVRKLADIVLNEESGFSAYSPDRVGQTIYRAVSGAFEYGLSDYLWSGEPLSRDRDELKEAFDYFDECIDPKNLERDFVKTGKKILAGIHPSAKQPFPRVVSYMAWALEQENGKEALRAYHRSGPIVFFNDYIRLSSAGSSTQRYPRFSDEFIRLAEGWEKDWERTKTDEIGRLVITPGTDFEALAPKVAEKFAGAAICPDLSSDFAESADYFLKKNDGEKAASILRLGRQVYPASPSLAAALGYVEVWAGRAEEARSLFHEAQGLDPTDPALEAEQFIASMRQLGETDKKKEAEELGLIAVEISPKEPSLYVALGDLYMLMGRREEAAESFKRALRVDPNFEDAKARLKSLKK
jgi:CubicO group peptidase (beta-lactamase class C family)